MVEYYTLLMEILVYVEKKASGSSVRPPLHQQTKFFDQECVDQYVKSYGTIKMSTSKVKVEHNNYSNVLFDYYYYRSVTNSLRVMH